MKLQQATISKISKKKTKIGFQDQLSLSAGHKYCRMLQHSAIPMTCIKPPFVIKVFVLSIFEWPLKTCSTGKIFFLALKLSNVALILLINVKMPKIIGILTFMSRIGFMLS